MVNHSGHGRAGTSPASMWLEASGSKPRSLSQDLATDPLLGHDHHEVLGSLNYYDWQPERPLLEFATVGIERALRSMAFGKLSRICKRSKIRFQDQSDCQAPPINHVV